MMFTGFFRELKAQIDTLVEVLKTREFWIYFAVIIVLLAFALGMVRLAVGFDPLTRQQLNMAFSCKTGEAQLGTIIVGLFVFAIACLFTLGEIVNWVEESRESRMPGRQPYKVGYLRPLLHVIGTIALGVTGYYLMLTWCT